MKKLIVPGLVLLVAGVVVALKIGCQEEPYHLKVVFPEAGGLKPGDNVAIRGLQVGQVANLDLHADGVMALVEIEPKFRKHFDDRARFLIRDEKMVTGKKMLVVEPGDPPGQRLPAGAEVRGEAPRSGPIERAKRALKHTVDHAREQAQGLGRAILNPDQQPPRTVGGTVDLDQPGELVVRLLSAKVHPTTADGADWDAMGAGDPDLLVQVWVGSRQILLTDAAEDVLEVEWDEAVSEPFDVAAGVPLKVKVLDVDVSSNDEIGIVELSPTREDARSGRVFRLAAGRVAELRLRIDPAP